MADALRAAKKARQEQAKNKKNTASDQQSKSGAEATPQATAAQDREKELEALAIKQLLDEANRGSERASNLGVTGWSDEKRKRINHRFLRTTLTSTERHNQAKDGQQARSQNHALRSDQTKKNTQAESDNESTMTRKKRDAEEAAL